jgi:stage III sporulation protein SpoIIIAA
VTDGPNNSFDGDGDAASAEAWAREIEETLKLVSLLPEDVRHALERHPRLPTLVEVVMDLGRPPLARFPAGDELLDDRPVTAEDLEAAERSVGSFGADNRAGVDGTLHRVSAMRNRSGRIVGLTCRVGRAVRGTAELVRDLALSGASLLFLGRPGVGKTTAIRELSRLLADDLQRRVVVVDTSNEIGGDGDVPHAGIGRARRMQVPDPEQQHRVMIEAVENHMPQVVVIDEIGTEAECSAARTIAQRGVQLIATAHGNELENVVKNPALADLIGGIQSVTLGDDEARRRGVQKSVLERAAPPTFDVAVEMLERGKWHVHSDVGAAVDRLLAGRDPGGEVRERVLGAGGAPTGEVRRYRFDPRIPGAAGGGGGGGAPSSSSSLLGGMSAAEAAAAVAAFNGPDRSYADFFGDGGGSGAADGGGVGGGRQPQQMQQQQQLQQQPWWGGDGRGLAGSSSPANGGGYYGDDGSSARGNAFVRPSMAASFDGASSSPTASPQQQQQQRRRLGTASPDEALLRLHCVDLDEARLWEVMTAMALHDKVWLSPTPRGSDAVLAPRAKLRSNATLRSAARDAGVPVYAIKTSSSANLVRAFRTLLGVEPSAGGVVFANGGGGAARGSGSPSGGGSMAGSLDEADTAAVAVALEGSPAMAAARMALAGQKQQQDGAAAAAAQGSATTMPRLADFFAEGAAAADSGAPSSSSSSSSAPSPSRLEREALEEAQMAAETIVRPLGEPVELLPRPRALLERQRALIRRLGLASEVLEDEAGGDARLRVVPPPS